MPPTASDARNCFGKVDWLLRRAGLACPMELGCWLPPSLQPQVSTVVSKRVCQGSRAKATHFSAQRRLAPQPGSTSLLCLYVDLGAEGGVQIIEFFELEGPWLRRHERKKNEKHWPSGII